jgi:hypothetical protein
MESAWISSADVADDKVVWLVEAHEILGHRTFDPFFTPVAERAKHFWEDAAETAQREHDHSDEYLVRGRYVLGGAEFEDTRYVYEFELRDLLRQDDGGVDKLHELVATYIVSRLMCSVTRLALQPTTQGSAAFGVDGFMGDGYLRAAKAAAKRVEAPRSGKKRAAAPAAKAASGSPSKSPKRAKR